MNNVVELPPSDALGPPPDYFNEAQLKAWNDVVEILPAESKCALFHGPIAQLCMILAKLRTTGAVDTEKQVVFRGFLNDFGLGEDAIAQLGLAPFSTVFPIE